MSATHQVATITDIRRIGIDGPVPGLRLHYLDERGLTAGASLLDCDQLDSFIRDLQCDLAALRAAGSNVVPIGRPTGITPLMPTLRKGDAA